MHMGLLWIAGKSDVCVNTYIYMYVYLYTYVYTYTYNIDIHIYIYTMYGNVGVH